MLNYIYHRRIMNAGPGCQLLPFVFLLLVSIQMGAVAQSGGTSTAAPSTASDASADARWDLNVVSGNLRRQDGRTVPATLGNIIDYLRDLYPANVVLAPGVGQIKVGDLKLASFHWEPALDALKVASGNAFVWKRRSDPYSIGGVDPTTGLPTGGGGSVEGDGGEGLLMLTLDESGEAPGPRRVVEVFNLGGYLRGQSKDLQDKSLQEIREIIESTLRDFEPGRDRSLSLRFQFHSGASLLVVSGFPGEVEVARKVVLALPETSSSKAQPPGPDDAARAAFLRRYGLNPAQVSQPDPSSGVAPANPPPPKR